MIDVKISRDPEGRIASFKVSGHSGYAEDGSDIVCAAVSTAVQSVALGAQEVLGIENCYLSVDDGFMEWRSPENLDEKTLSELKVLTETAYLVIGQAAEQFSGYVRISETGGKKC